MSHKVKKGKKRNWWVYLVAFCIPVICLLIYMIINKCYPFGENTILLGDADQQYKYFYTELYNRIVHKKSLLFSWDNGMGYDFYSNMMYYLASPFSILVILFGGYSIELGMALILLLQMGGCAVTMAYYLRHTYLNSMEHGKVNDFLTIVFSLAYAMSDYILAYKHNIMWLISLMLAPLILLGIEQLIRKHNCKLYIITLFIVMVSNFYFAWFICILSVIWFIDQNSGDAKKKILNLLRWMMCSIVAAVAAAGVLMPCYLMVLGRNDSFSDSSIVSYSKIDNIASFVQSFFWGYSIDVGGSYIFTRNNYCGIVTLVLVALFFLNKRFNKIKKIKRFILILSMVIVLIWAGGVFIMHGFMYPHSVSNRDEFILTLLLVITAFESICELQNNLRNRQLIVIILLFSLEFMFSILYTNEIQNFESYYISFIILMYLIACLFLYKKKSIKKNALIINIIVIGILEILSNAIYENIHCKVYQAQFQKVSQSDKWEEIYNGFHEEPGQRKTSCIATRLGVNMAYTKTDIFSSSKSINILWLFKKLGLVYQPNGGSYMYKGTTPVTASLFNVKDVLTDNSMNYGGYKIVNSYRMSIQENESDYIYALQNEYLAGLGYMVSLDIENWLDEEQNPLENQNEFAYLATQTDDIFSKVNMSNSKIIGAASGILEKTNNKCTYISARFGDYMGVQYSFVVPKNMHLYAYIYDKNSTSSIVNIDGKTCKYFEEYPTFGELIDLGELKEGQKVEILSCNKTYPNEKGTMEFQFYEFNKENADLYLNKIKEHEFNITKFEDTCIEGNITASEDGIMYTSIPYYEGFKVYVDGKQTEITKIGDALIGVKLQKGEHDIRITYFPYGLKLGIVLSIFGIAGMIVICKKNKKYIIK